MFRHAPVVVILGGIAFGTGYVLNYFWPKPASTATARESAQTPAEPRPIPPAPDVPPARPAINFDVPAPMMIELPPEPKPPILPASGQDAPKLELPKPPAIHETPLIDLPKPSLPTPAAPKVEVPPDLPKVDAAPKSPMDLIGLPPDEPKKVGAPPSPTIKLDPIPVPRAPRITEDAVPKAEVPPPLGVPPVADAPGSLKTPPADIPTPRPSPEPRRIVETAETRGADPLRPPELKPIEAVSSVPLPPLKFINTRDVAFKYEITKQGTSGIQAVELWVTEDDGKTWEMFVRQEGDRSPIKARLRGEGVYGFRLVLVNGNGHRCGEPKPGEAPAMRAELDLTLPYVRIDAIERTKSNDGVLDLRWTVAEKNFADRSCTPEWSEDGRDWKPVIADPKKDVTSPKVAESPKFGRSYAYGYGWKLPEKMPTKVWLRVRCKDLAGNESEYRWPSKVSADLIDPSAGLTTIEESRDGSMRRKDNATTPFPDVSDLPTRRE